MSAARELIARCRSAFVRADLDTLVDCFHFPLQVIGLEADQVSVSVAHREDWPQVLQGLFDVYARLGVTDAVPLALDITEPMPALSVVQARWALRRQDGGRVYDFSAGYTLARSEGGLRIVALAHDELPELRVAVAAGREQERR